MRRHRPPRRRRRADHPRLRPIDPPPVVAILIEILGRCPGCNAPLQRTPSGLYSVIHTVECKLARQVGSAQ